MRISAFYAGLLCASLLGCSARPETEIIESAQSHVASVDQIEAGRYLVTVAGCNDCHTDGYLMMDGKIPEENWLTGSPIGWQGPWGTTYPTNLRLRVQEWTEDQWVLTLKKRTGLPPMPWMNVNKMSDRDARAIYVYLKSLGPSGEHMPMAVAPGLQPQTPYFSLFPENMPTVENRE